LNPTGEDQADIEKEDKGKQAKKPTNIHLENFSLFVID
jgi:hypothetical protein